ncbi:cell division protein FtsN [Haemophilus parainfluenzae]|uniref:Cell division protein FtsN n=1 Tax=Haemophilus parainfluenzae TaxID=729 RepID=A0A410SJE0_HAEPA|nr:cell division protein FtsN [Haemophilus parainfluenzae]KAB1992509.1 cell division protein FtsN [Haemophilus parainfluenzae]MBS6187457.1 cell division protein FtsN [Haemophilus parainfluenzae]MDU4896467.1 cell division protein FtsN [Haemophilus parainfluenzae]MDU6258414.1 cell division protein FtsN [Haemophilus parainfluenzae]MDU6706469.1 cell division protein FtsN [Haemophilus parainfluenzae]
MAHRDFAGRNGSKNNKKKAQKSFNRNTLIGLALVAVLGFGLGLYFLKSKTPEPVVTTNVQPEKPQPKSVLPSRPEEVWHYIKELETRTVPVDNNPSSVEKNMRLTEEQRQVLIQMEKEQKAAEEAKKLEAQRKEQEATNAEKVAPQTQQVQPPQQTAKPETKKPEPVKKPEPPKKVEVVKAEPAKTEPAKAEQPKKAEPKPAEQQVQAGGKKFGLQCGAFKNRAQAESLQGRLAMAGVNAQIMRNEEWNRVRVGPFSSRDAATAVQDTAKPVASCVVIGM